jgi:short-subunit dehydrogenase
MTSSSKQPEPRPLAVITGASTGIGKALAVIAAGHGYELLIAADEERIHGVAAELRNSDRRVEAIQADLATKAGVDALMAAVNERPVEALFANAGRGLGRDFLDQEFEAWRRVVDTNITGTLRLIQLIGARMRSRGAGKILITGSIAGLMPGTFQAVYNGSKAFLDSFAIALREELKDSGVHVTCLMPGPTDTPFFERADMMDTKVGTGKKQDAAEVAQIGFDALMDDDAKVVAGWRNKLQAFLTNVVPDTTLAKVHRGHAQPGTAEH